MNVENIIHTLNEASIENKCVILTPKDVQILKAMHADYEAHRTRYPDIQSQCDMLDRIVKQLE